MWGRDMEEEEGRKIGRLRPEAGKNRENRRSIENRQSRANRQSGENRQSRENRQRQAAGRAGQKKAADPAATLEQRLSQWKKKRVRRVFFVIFGLLGAAYVAAAVYFSFHFYGNTVIYGIDCGRMTLSQAKEEISQKLDSYALTLEQREGREEKISAGDIQLEFKDDGSIEKLLKKQRAYLWPVMMLLPGRGTESVSFTYNRESAQAALLKLECFDITKVVSPQNAYLGDTALGYEVVPEVMGTALDQEKTIQAVLKALDQGEGRISLEEEGCYRNPTVYRDDEELNQDAEELNELTRACITYDFGDRREVVDGSVIKQWIKENQDGSYYVDEAKIREYVESLAAKYDTFGCDRQFYTSLGTMVSLSGGDYGWCIDQEATAEALIQGVRDGVTDTREPVYLYTAMSRDTDDIGYTYVEICISQQRMWCYENGYLVVDTPVVTGNPNKGDATPSGGVWAIDAKMRDTILEGEGYESPVDYWMPFNGDVGIHDMQNRYYFGGTIYLTNGSHGCVNTPYEQAKKIYETISIGSPVIVYD